MTYTRLYDSLIQQAMARYFPQVDSRWGKAQLCAESDLNPKAVSPAGAKGIAQFMDGTWQEVSGKLWPHGGSSVWSPADAVEAHAWYMGHLWNCWNAKRSDSDRLKLAQASYNAGIGNIVKAQLLAGNAKDYVTIITELPNATGTTNAKQTTDYVARIAQIYAGLVAADGMPVVSS